MKYVEKFLKWLNSIPVDKLYNNFINWLASIPPEELLYKVVFFMSIFIGIWAALSVFKKFNTSKIILATLNGFFWGTVFGVIGKKIGWIFGYENAGIIISFAIGFILGVKYYIYKILKKIWKKYWSIKKWQTKLLILLVVVAMIIVIAILL